MGGGDVNTSVLPVGRHALAAAIIDLAMLALPLALCLVDFLKALALGLGQVIAPDQDRPSALATTAYRSAYC